MKKCRHLVITDAYRVYVHSGVETPVPGHLCLWAVDHTATAPKWFEKLNGGGQLIEPLKECAGCPCYSPQE